MKLSKGFTLIELVISIFVMSVGLVGVFGAFSVISILTSDSANRLAGSYLAQEGVEIVRNIRDNNWLNMAAAGCDCSPGVNCTPPTDTCAYSWLDGLAVYTNTGSILLVSVPNNSVDCSCASWTSSNPSVCSNKGCIADYTTGAGVSGAQSMNVSQNVYLYVNKSTHLYGYNSTNADPTKFQRKVIINPIVDASGTTAADHIIKVIVQVSWDRKATLLSPGVFAGTCGAYNCVTEEDVLYDWYNYVNTTYYK